MQINDVKSCAETHTHHRWYKRAYNHMNDFYHNEYLPRHTHPKNRIAHSLGPALGFVTGGVLMLTGHWIIGLAAIPVITYGILLPSHPFFEGNKAASLIGWKNALKSIPCEFVMAGTDIGKAIKAGIRYIKPARDKQN